MSSIATTARSAVPHMLRTDVAGAAGAGFSGRYSAVSAISKPSALQRGQGAARFVSAGERGVDLERLLERGAGLLRAPRLRLRQTEVEQVGRVLRVLVDALLELRDGQRRELLLVVDPADRVDHERFVRQTRRRGLRQGERLVEVLA